MRSLQELISTTEPAMPMVRQWLAQAQRPAELLPPSAQADEVLKGLQVTTRSPMGAIAHETGGILIDHGWLRILGSGHERLPRNLSNWNQGRAEGFCWWLMTPWVVFAINGGGLGADPGALYYLAPDTAQWEALEIGYSDFVQWALSERLTDFMPICAGRAGSRMCWRWGLTRAWAFIRFSGRCRAAWQPATAGRCP